MPKESGKKLISQNRKARHDYFVDETYKRASPLRHRSQSIRAGAVNLKGFVLPCRGRGEAVGIGDPRQSLQKNSIFNVDPLRDRKLLMHKREIMKLGGLCERDGYTLVPLSVYLSGSHVKVELGLCRGKKLYDKRGRTRKAQAGREIEREMKERSKGDLQGA